MDIKISKSEHLERIRGVIYEQPRKIQDVWTDKDRHPYIIDGDRYSLRESSRANS